MQRVFPHIAIIGSGPAGCYTAQFLRKGLPDAEITVFEKLPVPFGLLRHGVAADHQGTKNVAAQFERLFTRSDIRFAGNIEIGRDITPDELLQAFDIVVAATGMPDDIQLDIPGFDNPHVIGAGLLLQALNSHPLALLPGTSEGVIRKIGSRISVIGNGNVAMDVVRLLAKTDEELTGSDINDVLKSALSFSDITEINIFGRSSVELAKFDLAMLKEVSNLEGVAITWQGHEPLGKCLTAELLSIAKIKTAMINPRVKINFFFNCKPLSISTKGDSTLLTVYDDYTGKVNDVLCDTVVTAVGFNRNTPCVVSCIPGVYTVGWLRRSAKGTVAENRRDANHVSSEIISDLNSGKINLGKAGFSSLKSRALGKVVNFSHWKLIDDFEVSSAKPGRCRNKLNSIEEMLNVAWGDEVKDVSNYVATGDAS